MGLFSGGSTDTTTMTKLNPSQQKLVDMAMGPASRYAVEPLKIPDSQPLVQGFTPVQKQAQQMQLDAAANPLMKEAQAGNQAEKFMLNDVLFPGSNPALQQTIDASVRPITQQLTEQTLPNLRSGASVAGQYGSSRQGIAEGLASQGASQAVGDTAAKVANANYQSGLDAMTKSLGLLPTIQQAQLAPANATAGVGDARQALAQENLDANLARQMYNQNVPLMRAQNLTALATGTPGGGTTSSARGTTGLLQGALGGGALGAGIGGAFGPAGAGIGAAGGAGLGALLALLG